MARQAVSTRKPQTGLEDLTDEQRRYVEHVDAGGDSAMAGVRVTLRSHRPVDKVVPVRMTAAQWSILSREAEELGVRPTTLLRMWLLERLREADRGHRGGGPVNELVVYDAPAGRGHEDAPRPPARSRARGR